VCECVHQVTRQPGSERSIGWLVDCLVGTYVELFSSTQGRGLVAEHHEGDRLHEIVDQNNDSATT